MSKLRTFLKLSMRERLFLFEIVGALIFGWIAVTFFPSKWKVRIYGESMNESPKRLSDGEEEVARHIGATIAFAKGHLPWSSTCMMDAIAAKVTLNRRAIPSTMYVGFRHGNTSGPFNAHAWVRSGRWTVTGGPVHPTYEVGVYYGSQVDSFAPDSR